MRSDKPRYKYYEMHENLEKMFRSPAHFELPNALKPGAPRSSAWELAKPPLHTQIHLCYTTVILMLLPCYSPCYELVQTIEKKHQSKSPHPYHT